MDEYRAVVQLVQLQCHNCHAKLTIDPTDQSSLEAAENWLKVQKSDGQTFGYCSVECLQKGAHNLKPKSNLVVPGE